MLNTVEFVFVDITLYDNNDVEFNKHSKQIVILLTQLISELRLVTLG